jgi:virginiamycin A acetyltransferase
LKDVLKSLAKSMVQVVFLLLALPAAALSGFGRLESIFTIFAHACALVPGLPGDYMRVAYYKLTLLECSLASRISFGSFFAHREATVGTGVYIGPYCVLGKVHIGDRTQIASSVQVLSGGRQHARAADGRISGSHEGEFTTISIGADCWIGTAVVVMADVGPESTIGAGSVVARPIPARVVAAGVPARVMKSRSDQ